MGQQCEAKSAYELPYLGTENAARDMDVLRGALGDNVLYYLGKSYGTYLGAVYAELFPKRVGRLVLDGALDPSLSANAMNLAQAAGFQRDVDLFTADWVKRGDDPFGNSVSASEAKLATFLQGLKTTPISGDATRKVNYALAVTGVVVAMYDQSYWAYLRQALTSALSGNGSVLLALADAYNDRGSNGTYTDNQDEANIAINCLDHPENTTVSQITSMLPTYEKASPLFGAMLDWGNLSCDYWPVQSTSQPHTISAKGAAPILVVGTTNDPATPYAWAKSLASQLSSGRLLTMNGAGHTAYDRGASGSTCIDNDVDAYLLNARLPAAGTVCQSNS
jgi:pimeloyl-ACP methyl ester carboxylesterase